MFAWTVEDGDYRRVVVSAEDLDPREVLRYTAEILYDVDPEGGWHKDLIKKNVEESRNSWIKQATVVRLDTDVKFVNDCDSTIFLRRYERK